MQLHFKKICVVVGSPYHFLPLHVAARSRYNLTMSFGQKPPADLSPEALEKEIEEALDAIPPELAHPWQKKYDSVTTETLSTLAQELRKFLSKRNKALIHTEPAWKASARRLGAREARSHIAIIHAIEGRPDLLIGEGKAAHVYAHPRQPVCYKIIRNRVEYDAWNSVVKEGEFLEKLQSLEVEGVRTPVLHKLVDTPSTKAIIMERLDAISLDVIMSRGKTLPSGFDRETFFNRLAAYLKELHRRGMYHRDIHEGNILIGTDNTPYVIDFGHAIESPSEEWAYEVYDRTGTVRVFVHTDEVKLKALEQKVIRHERKLAGV